MTFATLRHHVVSPPERWIVLGLAVLFAGLSIPYAVKASAQRSAIVRWTPQLQQLDEEDIYQRYGYPNPPIMAILLWPLAEMPPLAAAMVWFYLKVAMTLLALHWVFRLVERHERPFPPWAKLLATLLGLRPIMGDLSHGNVNLFILFLVIAALYSFHRGRDATAGVVLALAICCKVTPALFVPYFAWKRAWRALAGCAVGLVLFLAILPGIVLGPERALSDLRSWFDAMVIPYVRDGVVTSKHNNQSLPGLVYRLTTDSPSYISYSGEKYVPVQYDNFASLSPETARWIVKGCMIAFATGVVLLCRTATCRRRGWRLAAEFSLVLLGMLLFSERTWKQHCVTLILPFAVLTYYLATCPTTPRLRAYLVATLVLVATLMATTSTGLMAWSLAKSAQVYGAYVWCYLLLASALGVLLVRNEEAADDKLPSAAA
ncbi:MAG TPA: glycosyltransferase family 87 protein [Gemmataceae bacterium]|nr:glycosyltransferase family 87 protein [Gemmataceae bacterium]